MTQRDQEPSQPTHRPSIRLPVRRTRPGRSPRGLDEVAVEEPLEIRLKWIDDVGSHDELIATTMRTPGDDFDLAVGFLVAEGLLAPAEMPAGISHCTDGDVEEPLNVVTATLRDGSKPDISVVTRVGLGTSACGICGRTRMEDVVARVPRLPKNWISTLHGWQRFQINCEQPRVSSRAPEEFMLRVPGKWAKTSSRCEKMSADTMHSTNWSDLLPVENYFLRSG